MKNNTDTIKALNKTLDSLKKVILESNNWHGLKIHESAVQAALIVTFSTILTVVLGFIFKDYFIPRWIEKRKRRLESQYLFVQYKSQLIISAFTFLKRLHEIYVTRSHYLWKETPMSNFYQYKYKSSVYRLCSLLGALRAYRLIESSLILRDTEISSYMGAVESCLADGQMIEMYVAKSICKIANVDIEKIKPNAIEKLSIEVDNLVQKFQMEYDQEYIADLDSKSQDRFILELADLMKRLEIPNSNLENKKTELIKEVSIKLALIYRDWQQAIGEMMLKPSANGIQNVISFRNFENKWDKFKSNQKSDIWLERVEKIFENLDLRVDQNSDSRIDQLKRVYNSVYKLLKKLHNLRLNESPISENAFASLPNVVEI